MMNHLGAITVIISALFIGIYKAREEKRKALILRQLCSFLELMKNELCAEKKSISKFFFDDVLDSFSFLTEFIQSMRNNLSSLGIKRFCSIWSESINNSFSNIPDKAQNALLALGSSIGKYDSDIQKSAFERCESIIQSECVQAEKALRNNEKMYIGLGGCAGAILALMLV